MTRQYVLAERTSQTSRMNGVTMWRLTFYSLDDGTLWEMTVDASYRNFRSCGWDHVVAHDSPWGVYEGLRRTRRVTREGLPVLTADGEASLVWRAESRQQALQLIQLDQQERVGPTPFERIFA